MIGILSLTENEIEFGKILSANIQAQQRLLGALLMTEKLYIEHLRYARGLDATYELRVWQNGFEEVKDGKQNSQ